VVQSVELLLDEASDAAIRAQWDLLGDAGLPTARRSEPSPHHAPHITLWAGEVLSRAAEEALPGLFTDLDLALRIDALMIFGAQRGSWILVREVLATVSLLELQQRVVQVAGSDDPSGQFGVGRWAPHVTLARGLRSEELGAAADVLGRAPGKTLTTVRRARRWDGTRRTAWSVST
jgi:2'-5' RNA ligase superfamily